MISRFFIDRPIFAAVIALFFVLAGLAAMRTLPIAQYPEIAPPVVSVTAVYPGASAEVIEKTVAAPLENAINGIPNMIYMASTSTSNGTVQIQVTFDIGTRIEDASVNWSTPYVTVARLMLPRQDTESAEGKSLSERIEGGVIDPWQALAEHRDYIATETQADAIDASDTPQPGTKPVSIGSAKVFIRIAKV